MPVWHQATEAWREAGDLAIVGITQEQHPDRCRLFAQWQGLDWPILWDPFNVTGSTAVPFALAVDEHGVAREVVRRIEGLEQSFLSKTFDPPADDTRANLFAPKPEGTFDQAHYDALQGLLHRGEEVLDAAVDTLDKLAAGNPDDAALLFHAGVARRMRTDSPRARSGDFQAAIDHWAAARRIDPNQYIWRRRIQQYGPRLDKPYPFYTWVDQAREAIVARGETPVELVADLTGAELARNQRGFDPGDEAEAPDAEGRIHRDEDGLVALETAVAWDTSGRTATATVHVTLRPDAAREVHWTNDVEPLTVWVGDPDLPAGWQASARKLDYPSPPSETSAEVRHLDLELQLPTGSEGGVLKGYALYYVCEGESGECVFRRQDFEVRLARS